MLLFFQGTWMPEARHRALRYMENNRPSTASGKHQNRECTPLQRAASAVGDISSGYAHNVLTLNRLDPDAGLSPNHLAPERSISISVRNLNGGGLLLQRRLSVDRPLLDLLEELKLTSPKRDFQLVVGLAKVRDAHDTPASLGMSDGAEVFVVDTTVQINIRNLCGDILLQSRMTLNNPLSDLLAEHHMAHPGKKFQLVSNKGKIISPYQTVSSLGLTDDVEVTAVAVPVS